MNQKENLENLEKKGVSCIIINDEGEILLQLRDEKAQSYPNYWGLIGGTVEKGESPSKAIRREINEEINCNISNTKLFRTYIHNSKLEYAFIGILKKKSKIELHEGRKIQWLLPKQLRNLEIRPDDKETLEKFLKSNED